MNEDGYTSVLINQKTVRVLKDDARMLTEEIVSNLCNKKDYDEVNQKYLDMAKEYSKLKGKHAELVNTLESYQNDESRRVQQLVEEREKAKKILATLSNKSDVDVDTLSGHNLRVAVINSARQQRSLSPLSEENAKDTSYVEGCFQTIFETLNMSQVAPTGHQITSANLNNASKEPFAIFQDPKTQQDHMRQNWLGIQPKKR